MFRRPSVGFAGDVLHSLRIAVLFLCLLLGGWFIAARLRVVETAFFPVVSPIYEIKARAVSGGVEIEAVANKYRDCDWRATRFFYGVRGGRNVLLTNIPHLDKPKINGPGLLRWERIFVPIDPKELPNTFADAYHDCSWLPWWSRSRFYN